MNQSQVELLIADMPFTAAFDKLEAIKQTQVIIEANKQLLRYYSVDIVTDEMVALQSIFMAEGEAEGHAKFRRQGVTHMGLEDMRFTYDPKAIGVAPDVRAMVELEHGDVLEETGPPVFGSLF